MAEQTKSGPGADMTAPPSQAEVATFEKMMEMLSAFRKTHLFIAAVKLGVFCAASGTRRTASEIGRLCKVHESKKIDALLDLLVIEKLLVRHQADDGSFLYENSEGADALFSDKTSSSYMAALDILVQETDTEMTTWQKVTDSLQAESKLAMEVDDDSKKQPDVHADEKENDDDPENVRKMAEMYIQFEGLMRIFFNLLVDKFDFSRFKHILDIGGGTAQLSRILCRRHKHLHCTNFDLKRMIPIAQQRMAEVGSDVSDRVKIVAGNCLKDELPGPADVVVIANVLHGFESTEMQALAISKVFQFLPPGGHLVVIEDLINCDRSNETALAWELSAEISSTHGASGLPRPDPLTEESFAKMCKAAGFDMSQSIQLGQGDGFLSATVAIKPL